jgi:hypothetical protein
MPTRELSRVLTLMNGVTHDANSRSSDVVGSHAQNEMQEVRVMISLIRFKVERPRGDAHRLPRSVIIQAVAAGKSSSTCR